MEPELSIAEQRARSRRDERRPKLRERRYVDGEGHDLVVDDVRCDREWENANADQVREDWETQRDERRRQRQAERSRMSDGQRLDRALMELELGIGRRARRIESARSTGDDRNPGGNRPTHVEGVDIDLPLRLIRHHLATIEQALDAELGLIRVAPVGSHPGHVGGMEAGKMMTRDERDRIVWEEFAGVPAQQVADEAPYLGTSARTIERARKREAAARRVVVRPSTGDVVRDMTPEEAARAFEELLAPEELAPVIKREEIDDPRRLRRVVIDERAA